MARKRKFIAGIPIIYRGETDTLRNWCSRLYLEYSTVAMRFRRGERDPDKLFATTPVKRYNSDIPTAFISTTAGNYAYRDLFTLLTPDIAAKVREMFGHDIEATNDFVSRLLVRALSELIGAVDESDPAWMFTPYLSKYQAALLSDFRYTREDELREFVRDVLTTLIPAAIERRLGIPREDPRPVHARREPLTPGASLIDLDADPDIGLHTTLR